MPKSSASLKAVFYALGANAGIALAKAVAAFFTGSGAMLAEALHSFADCGNQVLLLVGMQQAQEAADAGPPDGLRTCRLFLVDDGRRAPFQHRRAVFGLAWHSGTAAPGAREVFAAFPGRVAGGGGS